MSAERSPLGDISAPVKQPCGLLGNSFQGFTTDAAVRLQDCCASNKCISLSTKFIWSRTALRLRRLTQYIRRDMGASCKHLWLKMRARAMPHNGSAASA